MELASISGCLSLHIIGEVGPDLAAGCAGLILPGPAGVGGVPQQSGSSTQM